MYNQIYTGSIGTVLNIDVHVEFAGVPLPAGPLAPFAWLAPTLVDRQPQLQAIVEHLDELVATRDGGKLLVVLRGTRPDVQQGLVVRCGAHQFIENYDLENGWAYLGRQQWPRGAQNVDAILSGLAQAMAFPRTVRKRSAVEAELDRLPKSLCFSHTLPAQTWTEDDHRLTLKWVDYLCHDWPPPPSGRLVVAFLCLDAVAGKDSFFDHLIEEFRHRAAQASSCSILITRPLEPVIVYDIDDWVSDVGIKLARYLRTDSIHASLLTVGDDLFSQGRDQLPYVEVYKHLRDLLATLVPSVPQFLTGNGR